MDFEEVEAYLYSLKHHGFKCGIDRMRILMDRIGHPEKAFPVIHVAGTNGKGSVCAMLDAIYRKAGYQTGLFTSPHLVYLGERIKVNGISITKEALTQYVEWLRPVAEAIGEKESADHPSFFEYMNAIGFQYFADEGVELGIVETGLGGEKDSTNIVEPEASIITSISKDHCEILGETIEQIAAAKAGIIKQRRPVILGELEECAEAVMDKVAKERASPIFRIRDRFKVEYPQTKLCGGYQRKNAAIAQLTCEVLQDRFAISNEVMRNGLREVEWPGRFQEIELTEGRTLLLDIAHNEEGVRAFIENLEERRETSKLVIVLGATTEGRGRLLIERLGLYGKKLVLVKARHPRTVSPEVLFESVPESLKDNCITLTIKDLKIEKVSDPGDCVIVVGSVFLVGDIFKLFSISKL